MAIEGLYTPQAITINSPVATTFNQLASATIDGQPRVRVAYNAGAPYPTFVSYDSAAPQVRFTTTQLQGLLTLTATADGVYANTSAASATITLAKLDENGRRSSSADSLLWTVPQSLLYWSTISAGNGVPATADVMLVASFDGTNAPLTYGTTTANYATSYTEEYMLGLTRVVSSALSGVRRVTISSGASLFSDRDQSNPYPDWLSIRRVEPSISLETSKLSKWSDVGFSATGGGQPLVGAGIEVFLRRRIDTGMFVADASAVHIKLSMASGLVYPQTVNVGGGDPAGLNLMAIGAGSDSDTNPLVIAPATAIA